MNVSKRNNANNKIRHTKGNNVTNMTNNMKDNNRENTTIPRKEIIKLIMINWKGIYHEHHLNKPEIQ